MSRQWEWSNNYSNGGERSRDWDEYSTSSGYSVSSQSRYSWANHSSVSNFSVNSFDSNKSNKSCDLAKRGCHKRWIFSEMHYCVLFMFDYKRVTSIGGLTTVMKNVQRMVEKRRGYVSSGYKTKIIKKQQTIVFKAVFDSFYDASRLCDYGQNEYNCSYLMCCELGETVGAKEKQVDVSEYHCIRGYTSKKLKPHLIQKLKRACVNHFKKLERLDQDYISGYPQIYVDNKPSDKDIVWINLSNPQAKREILDSYKKTMRFEGQEITFTSTRSKAVLKDDSNGFTQVSVHRQKKRKCLPNEMLIGKVKTTLKMKASRNPWTKTNDSKSKQSQKAFLKTKPKATTTTMASRTCIAITARTTKKSRVVFEQQQPSTSNNNKTISIAIPAVEPRVIVPEKEKKVKSVKDWNVDDVSDWLMENGLKEYIPNFSENKINGKDLLELNKMELKEDLGIKAFGDRKRMFKLIQKLKE